MCEPVSIALTAASALFGAYQQYQAGQAQEDISNRNAQIAERNAKVQEQAAADAIERGQEEARRERLRTSQLKGEQRAQFASNGALVDTGSTLEFILETVETGELDAQTIENNAERDAYDKKIQADNYRQQAGIFRDEGKQASKSGLYNAGGTLLNGASSVSSKWNKYKNQQVKSSGKP